MHWLQRIARAGTWAPQAPQVCLGIALHRESVASIGASLRGSIPQRRHLAGAVKGASGEASVVHLERQ